MAFESPNQLLRNAAVRTRQQLQHTNFMGFALSSKIFILFYAYSATFSLHKQMNDSAIRVVKKKITFDLVWYGMLVYIAYRNKKSPINSITISLGGNLPQWPMQRIRFNQNKYTYIYLLPFFFVHMKNALQIIQINLFISSYFISFHPLLNGVQWVKKMTQVKNTSLTEVSFFH